MGILEGYYKSSHYMESSPRPTTDFVVQSHHVPKGIFPGYVWMFHHELLVQHFACPHTSIDYSQHVADTSGVVCLCNGGGDLNRL